MRHRSMPSLFSFPFLLSATRFEKRGSSILRWGVLSQIASVRSGFVSLARVLWCFQSWPVDVLLIFSVEWLRRHRKMSIFVGVLFTTGKSCVSVSVGRLCRCNGLCALPFGGGQVDRGRLSYVRHQRMSSLNDYVFHARVACSIPLHWECCFLVRFFHVAVVSASSSWGKNFLCSHFFCATFPLKRLVNHKNKFFV